MRHLLIKALFSRLGLNDKESETFLKLLELGAQPISVLARHVDIPRTTMYSILEKLRKAGLIEEFERSGIKYVRCVRPENLEDVIHKRERELKQTLKLLQENLPQLEAMENNLSITPKTKFFEGREEVLDMYGAIMREQSFCAFVNLESVKRGMPEYHDEIPKMIQRKEGFARELVVDTAEAKRYKEKYESGRHQIKILKKDMQFFSDVIICKDKLYMTAYGDRQVSAVELFSLSLTGTHQVMFDALWQTL